MSPHISMGCIYCYARPAHAYVDLSPGVDFESILFYKQDAARLLRETIAAKSYRCSPINLGSNTDPYQPIEKRYRVTRECLEVLSDTRHPVTLITKGSLILRDLDLLASMARDGLASVTISLTTLEPELKRTLEPRAASPGARLDVIRELSSAGIPVSVLVAPVIPAVNDSEIEAIVEAVAEAGALGWTHLSAAAPRSRAAFQGLARNASAVTRGTCHVARARLARRQGKFRRVPRAHARQRRVRGTDPQAFSSCVSQTRFERHARAGA